MPFLLGFVADHRVEGGQGHDVLSRDTAVPPPPFIFLLTPVAILLNGQEAVMFSRVAGYVEQMDIHSPSATVAEALRFSAFLRLPRETPDAGQATPRLVHA